MAGRTRRRRTNVSWLPGYGSEIGTFSSSVRIFGTVVPNDGAHSGTIIPVTWDEPLDPSTVTLSDASLADFVGSAYTIKRIVGKISCFVGLQTVGTDDAIPAMVAGAGWFVARADRSSPNVPAGTFEEYDVLSDENLMEPWMWRRTWLLGAPDNLVTGLSAGGNNFTNRSALDGPSFDVRVKRRVDDDHRLYFTVSNHALVDYSALNQPNQITWVLDYRLLGTVRRNRNQSAF